MSHYARTIAPLTATTERGKEAIPVDAEIKSVRVNEHGGFEFWVKLGRDWVSASTDEDLPAFTDKGRAHREANKHATMRKGRPTVGAAPGHKSTALRLDDAQHAWLARQAAEAHVTVSEYVRGVLAREGMPS